jgi:VanZ family protein
VSRWLPVLAWIAVNVTMSHQPTVPLPGIPLADKAMHAAAYALLAILLARALPSRAGRGADRWTLIAALCFLYGLADEWHQSFVPGRSCDVGDALADVAGAALAGAALSRPRFTRLAARFGVR